MDSELLTYTSRTAHGGMNTRLSPRMLSDTEFTQLTNVDISIPGRRTKKLAPITLVDLTTVTPAPIPPAPSTSDVLASSSYLWQLTVDDWGELGLTRYTGTNITGYFTPKSSSGNYYAISATDDGEITAIRTVQVGTVTLVLASTSYNWLVTVDDTGELGAIRQ